MNSSLPVGPARPGVRSTRKTRILGRRESRCVLDVGKTSESCGSKGSQDLGLGDLGLGGQTWSDIAQAFTVRVPRYSVFTAPGRSLHCFCAITAGLGKPHSPPSGLLFVVSSHWGCDKGRRGSLRHDISNGPGTNLGLISLVVGR